MSASILSRSSNLSANGSKQAKPIASFGRLSIGRLALFGLIASQALMHCVAQPHSASAFAVNHAAVSALVSAEFDSSFGVGARIPLAGEESVDRIATPEFDHNESRKESEDESESYNIKSGGDENQILKSLGIESRDEKQLQDAHLNSVSSVASSRPSSSNRANLASGSRPRSPSTASSSSTSSGTSSTESFGFESPTREPWRPSEAQIQLAHQGQSAAQQLSNLNTFDVVSTFNNPTIESMCDDIQWQLNNARYNAIVSSQYLIRQRSDETQEFAWEYLNSAQLALENFSGSRLSLVLATLSRLDQSRLLEFVRQAQERLQLLHRLLTAIDQWPFRHGKRIQPQRRCTQQSRSNSQQARTRSANEEEDQLADETDSENDSSQDEQDAQIEQQATDEKQEGSVQAIDQADESHSEIAAQIASLAMKLPWRRSSNGGSSSHRRDNSNSIASTAVASSRPLVSHRVLHPRP